MFRTGGVDGESDKFDIERAYKLFRYRTHLSESYYTSKPRTVRHHRYSVIAAAALAFIIIVLAAYNQGRETLLKQFGDVVVEAPFGAKTELWLPDSTHIWLNAGSRLAYSQNFGLKERKLQLSGEAFFVVNKRYHQPFDVQTKELSVRVLGTKFNFRNYEDDASASVNLLEGSVALTNKMNEQNDIITLRPKQKAVLDKRRGVIAVSAAKVHSVSEWTEGSIFFDEIPMEDIVRELNRSYNVKIRIMDEELSHTCFYASFNQREQSIDKVLEIFKATHQISYRMQGDEILLYKR